MTILWHPDLSRVGERFILPFGETLVSRRSPIFATVTGTETGPLLDPHVSRKPLSVRVGLQSVVLTPPAGRSRAPVVEGKDLDRPRSWSRNRLGRGLCIMLGRRVLLMLHLHPVTERTLSSHGMVGESALTAHLRLQIERASRGDLAVLIRGETGSGKELVARAVHAAGPRADRPFVAVNMAAVPEATAAAAFFGYRRGAFTGADGDRPGYFGAADGGALFLDEVGETPASLQPMLLRALEVGEVQPVGSRGPRTVDVQVIAATDANLEQLIRQGGFKRPLYGRLRQFEIVVPPLRDRLDDLPRLLLCFLEQRLRDLDAAHRLDYEPGRKPWLSAEQVYQLIRQPWPGNVRDLRNAAFRIAVDAFDQPQVGALPPPEHVEPDPSPGRPVEPVAPVAPVAPNPERAGRELAGAELAGAELASAELAGPFSDETGLTGGEPTHGRSATRPTDQSAPATIHRPVLPPPRLPRDILVAGDGARWSPEHMLRLLRREEWSAHRAAKLLGVSKTSFYRYIKRTLGIRKTTELEADELIALLETHKGELGPISEHLRAPIRGLQLRLRALGIDPDRFR